MQNSKAIKAEQMPRKGPEFDPYRLLAAGVLAQACDDFLRLAEHRADRLDAAAWLVLDGIDIAKRLGAGDVFEGWMQRNKLSLIK